MFVDVIFWHQKTWREPVGGEQNQCKYFRTYGKLGIIGDSRKGDYFPISINKDNNPSIIVIVAYIYLGIQGAIFQGSTS